MPSFVRAISTIVLSFSSFAALRSEVESIRYRLWFFTYTPFVPSGDTLAQVGYLRGCSSVSQVSFFVAMS